MGVANINCPVTCKVQSEKYEVKDHSSSDDFAGMVNHHKNCCGWSSPADFIPCTHCGARFKQFRSIQTHNEKCHNNLFSNTSTSQSSAGETRSWASPPPPPLPLTPDIVPRHGASGAGPQDTQAPVAVPGPSHHHPGGDSDGDTSEMNIEWSRRQSTTSQPSSTYSVREEVLAEKEVQLSELENFVRQAEAKAEQARKERELSEWERNLQQREFEAKRRLEEATKILHESRFSDSGSISSPRSVLSPEPNRALTLASSDLTPASSQHSASPVLQSTPVTSRVTPRPPLQMFGPPRPPIVLPSSTKLPASAIKLSSSTLALLNAPGPCRRPLSLDETPMNLSRPRTRTSTTSNTSEDSCGRPTNLSTTSSSDVPALSEPVPVEVRPSLDQASSDVVPIVTSSSPDSASLPCVNISKDKVFELSVKVVDEGHSSIQAGDAVHVSYPLADESTSTYILDDNINLDNILQSSGSSDVTFVAEEGPNGQITLVPTNSGVDHMETDFDNIRRNMQAINVAGDNLDTAGENNVNNSENQEGCDSVDYFENRVKDFEFEINKEEFIQQVEENNLEGGGDGNEISAPPPTIETEPEPCRGGKRPAETNVASSSKKRKVNQEELPVAKEENVSGRRSSRFDSNVSEEAENSVPENVQKLKSQTKEVFNCGRCKSVLQSERSWKRHRDTVHGGSARLQGDPLGQLFNSEQEERAWNQALASFKKINCPRCNKKTFVKPAPLEQHLKTCCNVIKIVNGKKKRETSPIPEKSVAPVNNVDSPGRSRRKAATKARSTVAAFVKAMKTKFDGESSDGDPEVHEVMEDSDDNFIVQNEVDLNKFIKRTGLGKK